MTTKVQEIAEQVRALPQQEMDEFLSWLADYEAERADQWDEEITRDSQPAGCLQSVLDRVKRDIAEGSGLGRIGNTNGSCQKSNYSPPLTTRH